MTVMTSHGQLQQSISYRHQNIFRTTDMFFKMFKKFNTFQSYSWVTVSWKRVKKVSALYGTRSFITVFTKPHHWSLLRAS